MSQANMTLGNVARTLFRANLNDALAALASCQSGTSRPSGIPAGGLWVNTTTATAWVVNLFDGTDDIAIGTVNTTTNVFTPSIADNSIPGAKLINSGVTYGKIQNVSATDRVLGRTSAGAGAVEEIPVGTAANNLVRLDGSARLPAVDGSQLTNLSNTARAWVNFNGTGTVAIRGSSNVTSITDGGTGLYTVNFMTSMPDVNYAVTSLNRSPGETSGHATQVETYTTSSTSIITFNTTGTNYDPTQVSVAIFR
jgi:hypothetical protein